MTKIISKNKTMVIVGLLFTFLQLLFDTLNVAKFSTQTTVYIGAFGMLFSLLRTGWIQYFESDITNTTLWIQISLFCVYVAGGILDKLDILPFNDEWKSIIRVVLTLFTNFIPIVLKTLNEIE